MTLRKLTNCDIKAIAKEVIRQEDEKPTSSFWHDKRKRTRVILVGAMIVLAAVLEHKFALSWSHRIFEIGTDCIADFLLFGSVE